jgi:hypothetical protein
MTAWSHLPNAKHIDRVLASLAANPEKWDAARYAARDAAWDEIFWKTPASMVEGQTVSGSRPEQEFKDAYERRAWRRRK